MPRSVVAFPHRRRGSVLVLVMTLLGVLFVAGIAFLATMNFEADTIAALRQRERTETSVRAVVDSFQAVLRDAMVSAPGVPFGGTAVGSAQGSFAELPGVHNLFAPLEPIEVIDPAGNVHYVFDWFTDAQSLEKGSQDGRWLRQLKKYKIGNVPIEGIDALWPPGVPLNGVPINPIDAPLGPFATIHPVDADGDGVTDTLGFPLSDPNAGLGFSTAQAAGLQPALNDPDNPTGNVYLGLRVIPHGGMVNINESHPNLIANVLDLQAADLLSDGTDPDIGFFQHQPTLVQQPYDTLLEEPILRRRNLLPPQTVPPSLLQGNALLDPQDARYGAAHMPWKLYPPIVNANGVAVDFETVFQHGFMPFSMEILPSGVWAERFTSDPESPPLWAVRMEPFTSFAADPNRDAYDRRHLLTTTSHDSLLSRGGQWRDETVDPPQERDLVELMREANRAVNQLDVCPAPLPFEYAVYPHDLKHNTVPNFEDQECTDVDICRDFCRPDPRHGRLQLSLAWIDDYFDCNAAPASQDAFCRALRQRLIHDAFFMLVRNARGPYWDEIDCATNATLCDAWGEECLPTGLNRCEGGDNQGLLCITAADCPGGVCQPIQRCHDPVTGLTHRQSLISRTAASLTANMIDYMDVDGICGGGSRDGLPCVADADCGGGACSIDLNLPTRVPLRSFDCADRVCVDQMGNAIFPPVPCTDDNQCGNNESCWPTAGWELGSTRIPRNPPVPPDEDPKFYAYGLEQQPYITEVATRVEKNSAPPPLYPVTDWAVELFNPYNTELDLGNDYFLVEINPSAANPLTTRRQIRLTGTLAPRGFAVFVSSVGTPNLTGAAGSQTIPLAAPNDLQFANGYILYLVRRVPYPKHDDPTTLVPVDLVLDQFEIDPAVTQNVGSINPPGLTGAPPAAVFSVERMVKEATPWTATVPNLAELPQNTQTLGTWNIFADPTIRPVEVNFANTGSFTRLHPFNDPTSPLYNPAAPHLGIAFPTTGSLLLLMRHANRAMSEYTKETPDLAYTTWLGREVERQELNPTTGGLQPINVQEHTQVDNGRMPVFDLGDNTPLGKRFAHHVPPSFGACCLPAPPETCQVVSLDQCLALGGTVDDFFLGAQCSGQFCPAEPRDAPGGLHNLPWGQLVFDYFTALPLQSLGPYQNPDPSDIEWTPAQPDSIPRVDQNGLRVHGRINLNAAPWKVLAGLPLVPMERIPQAFRGKARFGLALVNDEPGSAPPDPRATVMPDPAVNLFVQDHTAGRIGDELAQGIVAYREARQILNATGDYGDVPDGRGWNLLVTVPAPPAARRGTGLVTVGELVNVRNPNATPFTYFPGTSFETTASFYRMDGGGLERKPPALTTDQRDYVESVAPLVALGDWLTVRSDVFTVYGTLRGEIPQEVLALDPTLDQLKQEAAKLDARAIRFQETVDRLPTFLGAPSPRRVGQRVVAPYTDVRND